MPYYRRVGEVPPKRHTQFRTPDGGLYYEELMGEEGFSSDSSLLYHRHIPSAIVDATPVGAAGRHAHPEPPPAPPAPALHELFPGKQWADADPVTGRRLLLGNADVRISLRGLGRHLAAVPQRDRRRVRLRRGRQRDGGDRVRRAVRAARATTW